MPSTDRMPHQFPPRDAWHWPHESRSDSHGDQVYTCVCGSSFETGYGAYGDFSHGWRAHHDDHGKAAAEGRPSWDLYFLRMAYLAATRATCSRKHVGAVLVNAQHRVISVGYNGSPPGAPHCGTDNHEIVEMNGRPSCIRTLHAESNALDYAGALARGATLYTTVTPCYDCAKRIVAMGVAKCVWHEFYPSRFGKSGTTDQYLKNLGVAVPEIGKNLLEEVGVFARWLGTLGDLSAPLAAHYICAGCGGPSPCERDCSAGSIGGTP